MYSVGDYRANSVVRIMFSTFDSTGASVSRSVAGSILIYKNNSTNQRSSSSGITDSNTFDSVSGLNMINIDTSDNTDAGFYASGNDYFVVLSGATIDGKTVNSVVGHFSIEKFPTNDKTGYSLSAAGINGIWDEPLSSHSITGTFGASAQSVYHADVSYIKNRTSSIDEYTTTWYKNGTPITSGITNSKIQVISRSDGSDLIAQTNMTQISSTGTYKYDAINSEKQTSGNAYLVVVTASIDGGSRTFYRLLGRDN